MKNRKGKNTMEMPNRAVLVAVGVMTTGPLPPVVPEFPEKASGLLTDPETAAPVLPELLALD